MMGESEGFTFRNVGRVGRLGGSSPPAAAMAAWTSRPAASTSRFRSNWSVMAVEPSTLVDVISVTPAIRPKRRSSGVATEDAMVSGLAPGKLADTLMVGKSTFGSGATGRSKYAATPASRMASASSEVAIGRLMKGAEMFTTLGLRPCSWTSSSVARRVEFGSLARLRHGDAGRSLVHLRVGRDPSSEPLHVEVDDG